MRMGVWALPGSDFLYSSIALLKKIYHVLKFLFSFLPLSFDFFLCNSQIVLALVSECLKFIIIIFIYCSYNKYFVVTYISVDICCWLSKLNLYFYVCGFLNTFVVIILIKTKLCFAVKLQSLNSLNTFCYVPERIFLLSHTKSNNAMLNSQAVFKIVTYLPLLTIFEIFFFFLVVYYIPYLS